MTENCRFANLNESPLAMFALGARIGEPNLDYLDEMNVHCLAGDGDDALLRALKAHPNGADMVILAPTHAIVDSINKQVIVDVRY